MTTSNETSKIDLEIIRFTTGSHSFYYPFYFFTYPKNHTHKFFLVDFDSLSIDYLFASLKFAKNYQENKLNLTLDEEICIKTFYHQKAAEFLYKLPNLPLHIKYSALQMYSSVLQKMPLYDEDPYLVMYFFPKITFDYNFFLRILFFDS